MVEPGLFSLWAQPIGTPLKLVLLDPQWKANQQYLVSTGCGDAPDMVFISEFPVLQYLADVCLVISLTPILQMRFLVLQ